MNRLRTAALLLLPAALLAAPHASAATPTDRTMTVQAGESATWKGAAATGANVNYFGLVSGSAPVPVPLAAGSCGKDVANRCDTTLLELSNPYTQAELDRNLPSKTKTAKITISDYAPVPDPATDFDLVVWAVDANGNRGAEVIKDGDLDDTANETVSFPVRTTATTPTVKFIVDVVYFVSAGSGFNGKVAF